MSKIRLLLTLILLLIPFSVASQDLSPKVQNIIRITLAADGYLNAEMHKEFWMEIDKIGTPKEIKLATEVIQSSILLASEYQNEKNIYDFSSRRANTGY